MKTLRDTNNNNSNATTTNLTRSNFGTMNPNSTLFDLNNNNNSYFNQNQCQQSTVYKQNYDTPSSTSTKLSNSIQTPINSATSLFNCDINQLSTFIQTSLKKFVGNNIFSSDNFNPFLYLQLINTNALLMQQLSTLQNNNSYSKHDDLSEHQQIENISTDLSKEMKYSQVLKTDPNLFIPKTRSMTQNEIVQHTRTVYQRALQRNQMQQQHDLMKHNNELLNRKQSNLSQMQINTNKTNNSNEVPTVPNVNNMTSIETYDTINSTLTSPTSCPSSQRTCIENVQSTLPIMPADKSKIRNGNGSILDPRAPIFVPRQNQLKLDDDNETVLSTSSSGSDFNDFSFLDQFLDEFYNLNNKHDNHLVIKNTLSKSLDDSMTNHNIIGQGDTIQLVPCEKLNDNIQEVSSKKDMKEECQYTIYELLNRFRNPRCHLILPEWSRLSVILPNVCSMGTHTYKMKRYFAYRRRLNQNNDTDSTISVQE